MNRAFTSADASDLVAASLAFTRVLPEKDHDADAVRCALATGRGRR
jgi:hypothetical protein